MEKIYKLSNNLDSKLGQIMRTKHRIEITSQYRRQSHSAPYLTGWVARQLEKLQIDKMYEMKLIEKTQTKRASNISLDPNNDVLLRFCVDYRNLNVENIRYSFSMPLIKE